MAKETLLSKMGKVDACMNKIYYGVAKLVNTAKELQEEYPLLDEEEQILDQIVKESSSYMDLLHARETNIIERIEARRFAHPSLQVQTEMNYDTGEITDRSLTIEGQGGETVITFDNKANENQQGNDLD